MKNTKKIVSLILAICMIASLAISASLQTPLTHPAALALRLLPCPAPQTEALMVIPRLLKCP